MPVLARGGDRSEVAADQRGHRIGVALGVYTKAVCTIRAEARSGSKSVSSRRNGFKCALNETK